MIQILEVIMDDHNNSLPPSFSGAPGEDIHHYFHNVLLEFKKLIHRSQNIEELEMQMETIINACRDMTWGEENGAICKKSEAEKLFDKLYEEFKRYIEDLQKDLNRANVVDLSFTLQEVIDLFAQR